MNLLNKTALSGILILSLCGCASAPESDPAYVPPTQYQNYNCKQISAEMQRVSAKIDQAMQADNGNQVLGAAVTVFALARGYNVNSGDDDVALKRLQNENDVLEETAIQKECMK